MKTKSLVTKNEVQQYFEEVLRLSRTGEKFPVDFDRVWPLAYQRKDVAVRAMCEGGTKDVDYELLRRNAEQNNLKDSDFQNSGGHNKIDYKISVPTLEWLIARKHRPVFEVYRRVFHAAMNEAVANGYVDYMGLLRNLGLSQISGSVRGRIRRNPQEFRRDDDGIWMVSRVYARVIRGHAELKRWHEALSERRAEFIGSQRSLFEAI